MKRRAWMALGMAAAGCRRKPEPVAVVAAPGWQALTDSWEQLMGGELSRPEEGVLQLQWGESLSAMKWTGPPLTLPFEIELEARRVDGTDFFCGLTFPARASGECLTWVVGGWGGGLVGISSLDDRDAAENGTARPTAFEKGRWYRLRLARHGERLEAWIDGTQVVDLDTTGRKLSLRPGPIDCCAPFGLATWQTTGEFRTLRWRTLEE